MTTASTIYKICTASEWAEAIADSAFAGSDDDNRDGFIHLSTLEQLNGTAAKHFRGQDDLVLIALDVDALGDELRWEPSRGGELFPHYYGSLPVRAAIAMMPLPLDEDGVPAIPESIA